MSGARPAREETMRRKIPTAPVREGAPRRRSPRSARAGPACPEAAAGDAASPSRAIAAALLTLALLAAVAIYWPGLSSPFLFDDDRCVHHNANLLHLWPPAWIHAGTQETRPVTNLSFALDIAAFGAGPHGHHLVNLALHLVSVLLLFGLVRSMRPTAGLAGPRGDCLTAAVAALVLALHPAHSTSALYIQGRAGLLATVFGLAAMLTAVDTVRRWKSTRHRAPRTVAVAALVALATLSKESGAVLPALVLLYDAALASRGERRELRERLLRFHLPVWIGLLPLALAYATLKNPHAGVFGAGVVDPVRFYVTQPLMLLFYLRLYLWPAGLAVDRTFATLSPAEPRAWLAALAVLLLLALLIWSLRRAPWAGFWGLWWLAALAPTTLIPSPEFAAERYLTLATPAVAALAAWALTWAVSAAAARLRWAPPPLIALFALLVAVPLAWATLGRAQVWRSDLALWREATRVSPGNARAWYQYALLLHREDSLEAAQGAVRRALAIGVPNHLPLLVFSEIKASKGEIDSSVYFAGLAAQAAPWNPGAQVGLARALARRERWEEAERAAAAAVRLDPRARAALYLRGRARAEQGDLDGARKDAATLAGLEATRVEAATLLGSIAAREGRTAEADLWLARATETLPEGQDESLAYLDALRARAPVLLALGRAAEAIDAWELYFSVTGAERWDTASLLGIARAFRTQGQDREAASALRTVTRLQPDSAVAWIELAAILAQSRDSTVRDPEGARKALERGQALASLGDAAIRAHVAEMPGESRPQR
jgi:tetratricopeptide (TPR) repeat protein